MKKFFVLFFALVTLFFFSNIILAAFPAEGELETFSVEADFSGSTKIDFSFDLKDISTGEATEKINWDPKKVKFNNPSPQWLWSTTYAEVKADITVSTVSFYMYQKNTESDVYKSTWARTITVYTSSTTYGYSGLVNKETKGGEYAGFIPLSYTMCSNKLSDSELKKEYDPEIMTGESAEVDMVARYFTDEADYYVNSSDPDTRLSNFNKEYTILACSNGPVFWVYKADGTYGPSSSSKLKNKTAYMYFGGNFMNIGRGSTFGTNKIIVEMVVDE